MGRVVAQKLLSIHVIRFYLHYEFTAIVEKKKRKKSKHFKRLKLRRNKSRKKLYFLTSMEAIYHIFNDKTAEYPAKEIIKT